MDLNAETLLTLSAVPSRLPKLTGGRPVSPSTPFRWIQRGLCTPDGHRVKLESRKIGRTIVTSVEALDRFFAALNPQLEETPPARTPADRHAASEKAVAFLDSVGFGVSVEKRSA